MLINTVLVFLNNALPAMFFISVTSSILMPDSIALNRKIYAIIVGLMMAMLISWYMSIIAEMFDGIGFELLAAGIHFSLFSLVLGQLFFALKENKKQGDSALYQRKRESYRNTVYLIAIILVIALNGGRLFVYLQGFMTSADHYTPMLLGGIIGFGISISSALLLLYILRSRLLAVWIRAPLIAFVFMSARQLSELSLSLIQADWLPSGRPFWNSSYWIKDTSEIGRFFHALIGYEDAPTISQVFFYGFGMIAPLCIIFYGYRVKQQAHS